MILAFHLPTLKKPLKQMTDLQAKLKQAKEVYATGVQQYQHLQHQLIQQEGAIRTLEELIAAEDETDVTQE